MIKRVETIQTIHIGHLGIVDHLILGIAAPSSGLLAPAPPRIPLRPVPLKTWEPVCQGLEAGDLDAALIPLPLAMDLYGAGMDIALVMFSHRGGSLLAARPGLSRLDDFKRKSLLIPHRLSIQHMLMHKLMADRGIDLVLPSAGVQDAVCAEAVPMGLMAEMIRDDEAGDIAGFVCPDPFASQAIQAGLVKARLASQDLWKDHPCCGLVVRRHLLDAPGVLTDLVTRLFRAAQLLYREPETPRVLAAAAAFLGQSPEVTRMALNRSGVTFRPELLVPALGPLETVQAYMVRAMELLGEQVDLTPFVIPHFAQTALTELNP